MWELDHKEDRVPKNWYFWNVVLEKTLESPLDCKEIKLLNPKGNQPWTFIERADMEAEAQHFGHLMRTADSLEKILMLGKIEGRRRRGWQRMRWLNGITDPMDMSLSKWGDSGQGSLACCSPWGHKESWFTDWTTTKRKLFPVNISLRVLIFILATSLMLSHFAISLHLLLPLLPPASRVSFPPLLTSSF